MHIEIGIICAAVLIPMSLAVRRRAPAPAARARKTGNATTAHRTRQAHHAKAFARQGRD